MGRRTAVVVTVRRGGRRAAGVRVILTMKGSRFRSRTTDRRGRATFVVNARRDVNLLFRAIGTQEGCKIKPRATVLARRAA